MSESVAQMRVERVDERPVGQLAFEVGGAAAEDEDAARRASRNAARSRDLPIPGSPVMATTAGRFASASFEAGQLAGSADHLGAGWSHDGGVCARSGYPRIEEGQDPPRGAPEASTSRKYV